MMSVSRLFLQDDINFLLSKRGVRAIKADYPQLRILWRAQNLSVGSRGVADNKLFQP